MAPTHRAIIARLLVDDEVPLDARVAGLLVALFGQPATRVLRLDVNQLRLTDGGGAKSSSRTTRLSCRCPRPSWSARTWPHCKTAPAGCSPAAHLDPIEKSSTSCTT